MKKVLLILRDVEAVGSNPVTSSAIFKGFRETEALVFLPVLTIVLTTCADFGPVFNVFLDITYCVLYNINK